MEDWVAVGWVGAERGVAAWVAVGWGAVLDVGRICRCQCCMCPMNNMAHNHSCTC